MSDKEKNEIPEEDGPVDDRDIDNLDQTEKAAFEKIMSEISKTDDSPPDTAAEPPKEESSSKEASATDPPTSGDATESPEADTQADNNSSAEKAESDDDDLNDDQRAALDKILAEISSDDKEPSAAAPDDDGGDAEEEPVPLDQVMSEIDSEDSNTDTSNGGDEDALTDDQQAALDQILSEISGDDQGDEAAATTDVSETDSDSDGQSNNADADNQPSSETSQEAPPPADDDSVDADSKQGLSLEEFDDELSSLLTNKDDEVTASNTDAAQAPQDKTPPSNDQSLEDINSALKSIVNEDDEKETEKVDTPEADSDSDQDKAPVTVLEEVKEDDETKDDPPPKVSKSKSGSKLRKPLLWVGSVCAVLFVSMATYWGYQYYSKPPDHAQNIAGVSESTAPEIKIEPQTPTIVIEQAPPTIEVPAVAEPSRPEPFEALKDDIVSTRHHLELKKEELLDLKRYYNKGIQEERDKLIAQHPAKRPSFKKAIKDRQIELSLRSIQRRAIYNTKLDTPLKQIDTYLEQLLYLERRTRLFELLFDAISGLSTAELKAQGNALIKQIDSGSKQLSVENVTVTPPSLQSIWQGLSSPVAPENGLSSSKTRLNPVDQQIVKAICKGDYERKYLLTTLPPKAAECLAKWPGKDLYLNSLTFLSPESAKQLAQWQGEWLSLNGIKTLSAESARHLSQWPGKRLSLNGVTRLSDEATAYLSQWRGDQLEMVGLTSIGRWENYVTHLFLSESLRRKLEVQ